jgi:hypothetical protein
MNLKLSKRYYLHNRQWAIKDAFDALVELVTNADDSYHRLYKHQLKAQDGGRILIETCASQKNDSVLIVRDRAEGMTLRVMSEKLLNVGDRSSEEGDRGFMARGAKDCSELGDVIFESIVDDKYYKATITSNADFIALEDGKSVNQELRKCLHVEKGNGTVVTIKFTRHRLPRPSSICENLPFHFALRDILGENSASEVLFRDLNDKENKLKKLTYYQPQGEMVCKEEFPVPGYSGAKARLIIYRSPEPLDDISDKFRKSGIIIKGKRGIHECSLLQPSFEKDVYGKKYFGRIECEYIDSLMEEYDKRIENREPLAIENPSLVVDPNRQGYLNRSHPFVTALLDLPTKRLKELIDKDRAANKKPGEEIADEELKKRFDKLAKAASKFLSEQIEDIDQMTADQEIDEESFAKRGILIFPTYANVALGNVRSFGLYVNRNLFNKEGAEVSLRSDSEAIEFTNPIVKIVAHKTKKNLLYGRFSIKGLNLKEQICIETKCEGLPKAEALINVVENKIEEREFVFPLEFEHKHYKVKEGSSKVIRIFAKYPEFVNAETEIKVISSDNISLPIRGKCLLVPVQGANFASAEITIEARRLCHELITLSAKLNDVEAITKIKVIQKEESGLPLKIELKDEDFGTYRAKWGDHEGQPYLLLISAKHLSLKRYLGPAPDFVGRDSIHFRAILAEIVAESICRKSLMMESKQQSWMFNWAVLKDDNLIADAVMTELLKRMKEFLPIAHQIMIGNDEMKT